MSCNLASTPVDPGLGLVKDESEKSVDSTLFKQVVGSLRYLCNTRPDISFAVGLISRYLVLALMHFTGEVVPEAKMEER